MKANNKNVSRIEILSLCVLFVGKLASADQVTVTVNSDSKATPASGQVAKKAPAVKKPVIAKKAALKKVVAKAKPVSAPVLAQKPVPNPTPAPIVAIQKSLTANTTGDHFRYGLGFALFGNFSNNFEIPSLSMVFDINSLHSIQVFGGVGKVSPNVNFGTGLAYRWTVAGDRALGFHVGAMTTFGLVREGELFGRLGPIMGFHLAPIPKEDRLQLSFDGGPSFIYNGPNNGGSTGPNFQARSIGGMMGASVHYFF